METDVQTITNVMEKEPAQVLVGVKEHQDHLRIPNTIPMSLILGISAQVHLTPIILIETTIVMEVDIVKLMDIARDCPKHLDILIS